MNVFDLPENPAQTLTINVHYSFIRRVSNVNNFAFVVST